MSVNRPPLQVVTAGVAAPGPVTVAGAQVGDLIASFNLTDGLTTVANTFEPVVSVAGQVQQSSATDFSAKKFVFTLFPQGWKSLQ
jgi:hypothetical protein